MKNPDRLRIMRQAEDLAVRVYAVTAGFPSGERFGIVAQMRRAAVSIGSNIAEGCGRGTDRAFVAFLWNSLGSTRELEFQLRLSRRLGYGMQGGVLDCGREAAYMRRALLKLISFHARDEGR